jgi:phage shock protein E
MEIKKVTEKEGFLKSNRLVIAGILLGAVAGYLYYHFVGCANGTCAITSNPYISVSYGGMMGGLLFSMFKKD